MKKEIKIERLENKMAILHEELRQLNLIRDFPDQYGEAAQPVVNKAGRPIDRGAMLND